MSEQKQTEELLSVIMNKLEKISEHEILDYVSKTTMPVGINDPTEVVEYESLIFEIEDKLNLAILHGSSSEIVGKLIGDVICMKNTLIRFHKSRIMFRDFEINTQWRYEWIRKFLIKLNLIKEFKNLKGSKIESANNKFNLNLSISKDEVYDYDIFYLLMKTTVDKLRRDLKNNDIEVQHIDSSLNVMELIEAKKELEKEKKIINVMSHNLEKKCR